MAVWTQIRPTQPAIRLGRQYARGLGAEFDRHAVRTGEDDVVVSGPIDRHRHFSGTESCRALFHHFQRRRPRNFRYGSVEDDIDVGMDSGGARSIPMQSTRFG